MGGGCKHENRYKRGDFCERGKTSGGLLLSKCMECEGLAKPGVEQITGGCILMEGRVNRRKPEQKKKKRLGASFNG